MIRAKINKKKLSDLDNFLESLAICGDFAREAGSAGVSDEQLVQWLNQWFNNPNPDIHHKILLARYKAQMRKNLRAPLMTREDFMEANSMAKEPRDSEWIGPTVENWQWTHLVT